MRRSRLADRVNALLEDESAVRELTIPALGAALALLVLTLPGNPFDWTVVVPIGVVLVVGFPIARSLLAVVATVAGLFLIVVLRLSRRTWFIVIGVAVAGWAAALWRWGPGSAEAGVATVVGWMLPAVSCWCARCGWRTWRGAS